MTVRGMFRPGMRGYIIPLIAGIVLAASAFLPWIDVDDVAIPGFPDIMALWIVGLGLLAAVLATLSLWTRKNSRHPLLVVGLMALGIMFLSMPAILPTQALGAFGPTSTALCIDPGAVRGLFDPGCPIAVPQAIARRREERRDRLSTPGA